jgi:predicted negative regulator of RcsB-dependent stress response
MLGSSPKRITRKEIRQPDRFVTLLRRGVLLFNANRIAVFAAAAIVVRAGAALFGWPIYSSRQNTLAAEEYARAVSLYHDGKYKEALESLKRLEAYSSSFYSRLGLLYAANTQAALQDPAKAAEALRRLLAEEHKEPLVRQTAYVALGYAQEQAGQCAEAIASFAEAEKIAGPLKADASLGKARCNGIAGNLKEALTAYRAYLSEDPSSDRVNAISLRVQELEAKTSAAAAPTK